jgi:cyclopropane fatty-acyl-phospholipid synthase-like methyltransferase
MAWPTECASSCSTIARSFGRYDRIVSVGMFEHVGSAHYVEFFTK